MLIQTVNKHSRTCNLYGYQHVSCVTKIRGIAVKKRLSILPTHLQRDEAVDKDHDYFYIFLITTSKESARNIHCSTVCVFHFIQA